MRKIKMLFALLTVLCVTINIYAVEIEDDYEEIDYVWLEEEIANAKKDIEPKIESKYAIVFDRNSKTTIYGKSENVEVPMASTTKIMTAIVALERIPDLNEKIEVSREAALIGGSRLGLKTGDIITYNDLLYGLMLCSGNDAAIQIAVSVAGNVEGFAKLMNNKAIKLGLQHTNFVTPHGLDNENHYTTALELAKITDYALNIEKFRYIVSTKNYTVRINGYSKNIRNTNELLGYLEGVNGVKTGFTNGAGRCLVTSVSRDGFDIITVVLGANTKKIRTRDSIRLIEYTYNNYELIDLEKIAKDEFENWKRINEKRIKVYKGRQKNIETYLAENSIGKYPVLKKEKKNINIEIEVTNKIEAPINASKTVGQIKIKLNTTEILSIDILNYKSIKRKQVMDYLRELLVFLPSLHFDTSFSSPD